MDHLRLRCHLGSVNVRLRHIEDVWIAPADTPDGPTLGLAMRPMKAIFAALEPFDERRPELMQDLVATVGWHGH